MDRLTITEDESLIGIHPRMLEIFEMIRHLSNTDANVLIQGEPGSGKGSIAKAIHRVSPRSYNPFVKISCAVLSESALDSELFGYENKASTGSHGRHEGRLEIADGGTIFLDEVGEIPPQIQVKLLRVLQDSEFEHIDGDHTFKTDVRVIAATRRDLRREVARGKFREDLFYRLNVISLALPPLRERPSDIPELAHYFVARGHRSDQSPKTITKAALSALMTYPWPGNVRELENVITRAVALAPGNTIDIAHLPKEVVREESPLDSSWDGMEPIQHLREARRNFERRFIEEALHRYSANISRTAREIHIARRNLQEKIRQLGIDMERIRDELSRVKK
jgi:DNA-binding NtrC family response regulator